LALAELLFFDGNTARKCPPQACRRHKIAKVIMRVPTKECTATLLADWVKLHPRGEGKLIFALTWIGSSSIGRRLPIELKQALRTATERSVRWFESAEGVSSAAIQKLGLIEEATTLRSSKKVILPGSP
jgi:hypothetical protein